MQRRSVLSLWVAWLVGCAGAGPPPDARTTVLSLQNADCAGCMEGLASELRKQAGVYQVSVDRRRAEIAVSAAPSFDVLGEAKRLKREGDEEFTLVLGAGRGSYLPWAKSPDGADVEVVAEDGADVPDLQAVAVGGKVTVVDFSALWCEPCRKLDAHLMEVVRERSDVAYRKLDVGDWDTPLAERYLKEVAELPYVLVFDKQKRQVASIVGLDIKKLDTAIARATAK